LRIDSISSDPQILHGTATTTQNITITTTSRKCSSKL
jgi:hypothetical protein